MKTQHNKHFTGIVKKIEPIAAGVFEATIELPPPFSFQPGHYVWIALLDVQRNEIARRAFSIASIPNAENTISVITSESESVFKKELLAKKPGDAVLVVGPFGASFLIPEDTSRPLILCAGGLGIAPFLGIMRYEYAAKSTRPIYLFYTEDTPSRTVYKDELLSYAKNSENVFVFCTDRHLKAKDFPRSSTAKNPLCYISGPRGFVETTTEILLSLEVPHSALGYEAVYPRLEKDAEFYSLFTRGKFSMPRNSSSVIARQLALVIKTIESSSNHIIITDRNGVILFANSAVEKLTGFTIDEIIGNTPRLWGGMMEPGFYRNLWREKSAGGTIRGKLINRRKNGELYSIYSNIAPIKDAAGIVIGWIATEEDITEIESQREKLAEQGTDLEKSKSALLNILEDLETEKNQIALANAKNTAILSSIVDGLISVDKDGMILFANKAFETLLATREVDVVGKKISHVIQQEDSFGKPILAPDSSSLANLGRSLTVSTPDFRYIIRKDGTKFPAVSSFTPISIENTVFGAVFLFRDVTKEKELERAKSEFVSIASHQLRTPLTGIRWVSEYLLKKLKLPAKPKSYLQDIHSSTARLADLLDILLNLARIEEGAIGTSPQPLEIVSFIQTYLDECRPLLDKKKLKLDFHTSHSEIDVHTDTSALRNIVQSIISNAIEYTPAKGAIHVSLEAKKGYFLIQVSDSGIGIPKDEQPKIFTKFMRATNAQNVKAAGTGLGVYIAKQATELLGGKIWFTSEENKGTTFFVELPVKSTQSGGTKSFSHQEIF